MFLISSFSQWPGGPGDMVTHMLTALLIRRSDAEQGNGRSSICPCPTRGRTVCWVSHAGGGRCVCVGRGEERCGGGPGSIMESSVKRHLYFWSRKRKRSAWKGGSLAEEKGGEIPKELIDCLRAYRNNHAPSEVWSIVSRGGREIGSGDTKTARGIRVSV